MAKKILLFADYPLRGGLIAVLGCRPEVKFVQTAAKAEVVLAYSRFMVLKALEQTTLPVWQVVYKDAVNDHRVRHFGWENTVSEILEAIRETPKTGR